MSFALTQLKDRLEWVKSAGRAKHFLLHSRILATKYFNSVKTFLKLFEYLTKVLTSVLSFYFASELKLTHKNATFVYSFKLFSKNTVATLSETNLPKTASSKQRLLAKHATKLLDKTHQIKMIFSPGILRKQFNIKELIWIIYV